MLTKSQNAIMKHKLLFSIYNCIKCVLAFLFKTVWKIKMHNPWKKHYTYQLKYEVNRSKQQKWLSGFFSKILSLFLIFEIHILKLITTSSNCFKGKYLLVSLFFGVNVYHFNKMGFMSSIVWIIYIYNINNMVWTIA